MSHEIMACSFAVESAQLRAGLDSDALLALVGEEHGRLWTSSSRSGWYQGLLQRTLAVYPGYSELEFLLHDVVALSPLEAKSRAASLRRLLQTIARDPEPFSRLDYTEAAHQIIRQQVAEAEISRQHNDDSNRAHQNFFTYLLSQAAALEEASRAGLAFVTLLLGPNPPQQRLIWPA